MQELDCNILFCNVLHEGMCPLVFGMTKACSAEWPQPVCNRLKGIVIHVTTFVPFHHFWPHSSSSTGGLQSNIELREPSKFRWSEFSVGRLQLPAHVYTAS